jgi:hypothetical protein
MENKLPKVSMEFEPCQKSYHYSDGHHDNNWDQISNGRFISESLCDKIIALLSELAIPSVCAGCGGTFSEDKVAKEILEEMVE